MLKIFNVDPKFETTFSNFAFSMCLFPQKTHYIIHFCTLYGSIKTLTCDDCDISDQALAAGVCLALTAADVMTNPALMLQVKEEFARNEGSSSNLLLRQVGH